MNLFSFIKEHLAILNVVGEYLTLKKAGGYYKGTCPFHHEKTASFTVSPDKQIFYCFGCHATGDVISFIAKMENCSQKDAADMLIDRYKLNVPHVILHDGTKKVTNQKNHYFSICKTVALWCHRQLLKNNAAQAYLYNRGFKQQSLNYFTLGYFPGGTIGIQDLVRSMQKESIMVDDLIEANIIAQGRTTLYSPFEERIIFPIKDTLGRHCGFGGRTFKETDTRPKYYNSRESSYFVKGSLLFGIDLAKKSIQETGIVFLVEGYTDCIAMVEHNTPNAVATLGTACTIEHLKQLARYAEQLYIVYDNDTAGNQAVLRLAELCWQVNLELNVITLPKEQDPASFLSTGGSIHNLLTHAQDIFHFFTTSVGKNFANKSLNQKIQIIRSFLTIINTISDPLKKDIILQRAAKTFDIPLESLKNDAKRIEEAELPSTAECLPAVQKQPQTSSAPLLEKRIFCAIINNRQLLNGETCQRLIEYLHSPLQAILKTLKKTEEKQPHISFSSFFDTLNESEKQYVGTIVFTEDEKIDTATFESLLAQLQKKQWKKIVLSIKTKLALAKQEGNSEKVSQILHDFMELQNKFLSHNP